eukprot:CAMPEP_0197913232 /NCGR_PEP_ID=MMETSP1439-20131203/76284_1 /TAXON_ID=66791 /ORGANISM="Gonyaulax spinifera, Strain CCMP409" /LENGTH=36 /DNA_ID= /DNA_START= /DNA_END= /DNA_ORIENTATION=
MAVRCWRAEGAPPPAHMTATAEAAMAGPALHGAISS